MDEAQQGATQVVCQVLGGRNLNQVLSAALQSSGLPAQQRAALQDLSYGTLRFYGQLDRVLRQLLHKPVQDKQLRCLLLVALYQLQYSKAAHHAVVDHAVRAARKLNPKAAGLANAVLRNFLRERDQLLAGAAESDEGRYSYPQWWVDEIRKHYGAATEAILLAGNLHPPMTLRVNCRRTSPEEYLRLLSGQGIGASQIGADALLLERPMPVERLPGFGEGLVSVQDAGAQYAAHLLDVHDGMRVLDACAAPGGKTTHILERAQVDLLALDKDEQRLQSVWENLQRLQFSAQLRTGDAAHPEQWWDGRPFQRILADVPCSASGVVRRHPDIKWLRRREDIVGFAQQQGAILAALWQTLASDGKLLYATCSVFPQENRAVIDEFLRQHSDARQLPLPAPKMDKEPGLNQGPWLNEGPGLTEGTGLNQGQILPNEQHDGFFYALLHKRA